MARLKPAVVKGVVNDKGNANIKIPASIYLPTKLKVTEQQNIVKLDYSKLCQTIIFANTFP